MKTSFEPLSRLLTAVLAAISPCILFPESMARFGATCCGQHSHRDKLVIGDRDELLGNDFWIYDDLDEALATAADENKPLMVVLRCIP